MRYLERNHGKEPMPWLKHKLYLLQLWTGAYMLDTWEVCVLLALLAAAAYYGYGVLFSGDLDAAASGMASS